MKKFLSIVSLLLVAMMVFAVPTFAEEADGVTAATLPAGIKKYYANNISGSVPTIDGVIEEGEYGDLTVRVTDPAAMVGDTGVFMTEGVFEDIRNEYVDFWFAYDENNIYIAIHVGPAAYNDNGDEYKKNDVIFRNNTFFKMGFDLNDLVGTRIRFGGSSSTVHWNDLRYYEFGKANVAPVKTNTFITELITRKVDVATGADVTFGDLTTTNGNANYADGAWEQFIEMKIDRKATAQMLNECFFTDYDDIGNAMYFAFDTNTYKAQGAYKSDGKTEALEPADAQYWAWMGQTNIAGKQGEYADFGLYEGMSGSENLMDLIVFGDENTVIVNADPFPVREETEPTETEPEVTEAPTNENPTEAPVTEAPVTEAPATAEGGCGGSVAVAGIALVAALGTCTAFVAKKKED